MEIYSLHLKRPALLADFVSRLLAKLYLSESLTVFNGMSLYSVVFKPKDTQHNTTLQTPNQ